ncbi:unnamed protein product [Didymodactylos carnosus]|uniref:Uncharacterized protein n=1 Tax=Didymodactylos carnosus TaxID=1234261 RepID=A0A8S2QTC9_9BILA|nr:unnamed protein product [Didymodactylos carnosus]CAF4124712.1 unnamed protein product [Didymodactylos carnosus]
MSAKWARPTVLSVTLAIGAQQLSQHKAIVTHITAIEELAAVSILCSDKTGTLTLNKLEIDKQTIKQYSDVPPDDIIRYAAYACRIENQDAIAQVILPKVKNLNNAPQTVWVFLCASCDLRFYEQKKKETRETTQERSDYDTEDMDVNEPEPNQSLTIENSIFAGSGHGRCIVCLAEIRAGAVVMSKTAKLDLLVLKRYYSPHGVGCCFDHLLGTRPSPDCEIETENRS